MTKKQEELKRYIEEIGDENVIEKVKIFIMGILAQQRLDQKDVKPGGSIPES